MARLDLGKVVGDSATIAVGTVTTLEPGQNATVENVGTENAAIINFGIPRGADGQDGQDGRDGQDYVITQEDYQAIATVVESDITIPKKTSDLTNDSGFINKDVNNLTNYYKTTEIYTKTEVDNKVSSVYKYKGTVSTYGDLPSTDLVVGDVYNIETADSTHGIDAGDNVAWNGTTWDVLAGTIDLSNYLAKDNTTQYIPVDDYNPATKGYIDAFKNRFFEGSDEEWDELTDEQKASYLLAIVTSSQIIFDTDLYYLKKYKFTFGQPIANPIFNDETTYMRLDAATVDGQAFEMDTYVSAIEVEGREPAVYLYLHDDTISLISQIFGEFYDWASATKDKWYKITEENEQVVITELNDDFSLIAYVSSINGYKDGASIQPIIISEDPIEAYWSIDGFQWYFKNIEEYHTDLHIGDEYRFVLNDTISSNISLDPDDEVNNISIDLKDGNNVANWSFLSFGFISNYADNAYVYLRDENISLVKHELGNSYDWDNADRDKWYHAYLDNNTTVIEQIEHGPTMIGNISNNSVNGIINGVEVVADENGYFYIDGFEWAFANIDKIDS